MTILVCEGLTNKKIGAVPMLVYEGLIHQKIIPNGIGFWETNVNTNVNGILA